MGLLDSMLGGGNGSQQSGLSAATKALLVVLAVKAAKDYFAHRQASQPAAAPAASAASTGGGGLGGVLGGLLGAGASQQPGVEAGGLGGVLGGGGLASVLGAGGSSLLGTLVDRFRQNGYGDAINSWIGQGPNPPIEPQHLAQALGAEPLRELEQKTGVPQQTLLEALARELPHAVDAATPQGRLPTDDELAAGLAGHA